MAASSSQEIFALHLGGAQRSLSCAPRTPLDEVVADVVRIEGIPKEAYDHAVMISEAGQCERGQPGSIVPEGVSIVLMPPAPRGRGRTPAAAPTTAEIEQQIAAAGVVAPPAADGQGTLPLPAQNVELTALVGVLDMLWHWSGIVQAGLGTAAAAEEESEQADTSFSDIVDQHLVESMMAAGFTRNQCMRALVRNNMDPEQALEWLLQHAGDPTTDAPLTPPPKVSGKRGPFKGPDPVMFQQLRDMGFGAAQASAALQLTRNNFDTACDMLLQGTDVEAELAAKADTEVDENSPLARALLAEPSVHTALASTHVRNALRLMIQDSSTVSGFLYDPALGALLRTAINVLSEQNTRNSGAAEADEDDGDYEDED